MRLDRKRWTPALCQDMRLQARTAVIKNGFVQLPAEAPWLAGAIQS